METITLTVTGMSCAHCEKAVKNALIDLGALNATASAKSNSVEFSLPKHINIDTVKNEIIEMGYNV